MKSPSHPTIWQGSRFVREHVPAGMGVSAGEYGYDEFYFGRMLEAQAVDVLQAELDTARRQLEESMQALEPAIALGLPIVGLEPSCVASFRDELVELFPSDKRATYLGKNMLMLSELIERRGLRLPRLDAHALVHLHCNHRAVMGVDTEMAVIERLFASHEIPEPGCCGMAGPFGFDADKYDVSMKIGEQALLPAGRYASKDTWLVADGFSCREQLLQGAGRESVHMAEAIWYAMNKE